MAPAPKEDVLADERAFIRGLGKHSQYGHKRTRRQWLQQYINTYRRSDNPLHIRGVLYAMELLAEEKPE